MPMRYATEATVLRQLRIDNPSAEYTEVVALENGLCEEFDHKIGRSFGTAPVAETRTLVLGSYGGWDVFGLPFGYWPATIDTANLLILDTPIRSVTAIETGGTWDGTAWVNGYALAVDEYRLVNGNETGYYAIALTAGTWGGVVRITGIWADQDTLTVPADVREALTFLTVQEWHTANSSPAGLIGPDGLTVPTRNPWAYERVKTAIDRHSIVRVLV